MTAIAPEFLTPNLSPATPEQQHLPDIAPYKTVFPTIIFLSDSYFESLKGLITIFPPERPLPT